MVGEDALKALQPVLEALDRLAIPYYIAGSLASSAYGVPRSTMDVDLVVDIRTEHAPLLASLLARGYYVDENMIADAVTHSSSFNVIHLDTMFKVDLYVLTDTRFAQTQFSRRRKEAIRASPDLAAFLCSPEDAVLSKMDWFRKGGGVSERQWNDLVGVLKVQGKKLDVAYLGKWAAELGVSDLLDKAMAEAADYMQ